MLPGTAQQLRTRRQGTGKAPEFAVIEAKTTTANLTNSYPATIKGKQDVEIRPMVSGFITKLHVDEGATVRKGQVLFSIDPYSIRQP